MTIKQHGGVFGRNPSFNDVEVESLTIAGDAVPDASTILVDSDVGTIASQDADSVDIDGGAIDGATIGANAVAPSVNTSSVQIGGTELIDSSGNLTNVGDQIFSKDLGTRDNSFIKYYRRAIELAEATDTTILSFEIPYANNTASHTGYAFKIEYMVYGHRATASRNQSCDYGEFYGSLVRFRDEGDAELAVSTSNIERTEAGSDNLTIVWSNSTTGSSTETQTVDFIINVDHASSGTTLRYMVFEVKIFEYNQLGDATITVAGT